MSLAHINIQVADIEEAERFYTSILEPLGYFLMHRDEAGTRYFRSTFHFHPDFAISRSPDILALARRIGGNGVHIIFQGSSRRVVDSFYDRAIWEDGITSRKAPGPSDYTTFNQLSYSASIIDRDKYIIECINLGPAWMNLPIPVSGPVLFTAVVAIFLSVPSLRTWAIGIATFVSGLMVLIPLLQEALQLWRAAQQRQALQRQGAAQQGQALLEWRAPLPHLGPRRRP